MITLHCQCGEWLGAGDGEAGRWGRCPACRHVVHIPAAPGQDELHSRDLRKTETKLVPLCPHCQAAIPPGAVLCVGCGIDLLERDRRIEHYRHDGEAPIPSLKRLVIAALALAVLGVLLGVVLFFLKRL